MPADPSSVVTRIADLALSSRPRAGSTRVLAIDGRSGSGKSTLAARVHERLAGTTSAHLLELDRVYPGWDGLLAAVPLLVEGVLRPLAEGRPARVHRWDWRREDWWLSAPRAFLPVPVTDVLVVEGVGSGGRACLPYLSALVFLEADAATRHARAMARDGDRYRPHWDRWAAQEDVYLRHHDPATRADLVVDTSTTHRKEA